MPACYLPTSKQPNLFKSPIHQLTWIRQLLDGSSGSNVLKLGSLRIYNSPFQRTFIRSSSFLYTYTFIYHGIARRWQAL